MRLLKSQSILRLMNSYLIDSPQPANLSYLWNFGSLLGMCLILQILTGVFLAMHYTPHVDFAFNSVEHIMRDVNAGYLLRYTHANVASFFFMFVYAHIAKGLFYNSYRTPRVLLWNIGVIIFILMMATAFLGYVLPYGQMSLWGSPLVAPNIYFFTLLQKFINYLNYIGCLDLKIIYVNDFYFSSIIISSNCIQQSIGNSGDSKKKPKIRLTATNRIGPHNKDILSIIFGSLLGDCYGEFRKKGNGTRFCFYQEGSHLSYLIWLHNTLAKLNYCSEIAPKMHTRLGKKGKVRKVIRFKTWTFASFNWIHELWYLNNQKIVPKNIGQYLTPLGLSIWIMDDGCKVGDGLKLCTNSFRYSDCLLLIKVLFDNFNIKSSIQSAGAINKSQYHIYIWKESMPLLRDIVLTYVHPSMKYKLISN